MKGPTMRETGQHPAPGARPLDVQSIVTPPAARPGSSTRGEALCLSSRRMARPSAFVRAGLLTVQVCDLPAGHRGPHRA